MDFREYQFRARTTDQHPRVSWTADEAAKEPQKHNVIPLMGLVGEVGGLLSEYKKMLRDGAIHEQFPQQVAEELGDILWYVATVATKFGLDLSKIAEENIIKTEDRWHEPGEKRKLYDDDLPVAERLPRQFSYLFSHRAVGGGQRLVITDEATGEDHGDPLRDNAYEDDGYRFHDVLHFAFAAHLGWSPVWRKLLRSKGRVAKRPAAIDDAEDGGRAQVIDEAIVAAAYVYADKHSFMDGAGAVDWQLLRHIKQMAANLEVKDRTTWEWNRALLDGFRVWRKLREHNGGTVSGDLTKNTLQFTPPNSGKT